MSFGRAIKLLFTLRCKESEHLLSEACERELTSVERSAIWLHHLSCKACRRVARQLRQIDQVAKARAEQGATLSQGARDRITAALANKNRRE